MRLRAAAHDRLAGADRGPSGRLPGRGCVMIRMAGATHQITGSTNWVSRTRQRSESMSQCAVEPLQSGTHTSTAVRLPASPQKVCLVGPRHWPPRLAAAAPLLSWPRTLRFRSSDRRPRRWVPDVAARLPLLCLKLAPSLLSRAPRSRPRRPVAAIDGLDSLDARDGEPATPCTVCVCVCVCVSPLCNELQRATNG